MRDHLTFILDRSAQQVRDIAPTTTLLQWLRREKRMTGSKEGCAEGDCGACTVVVGDLIDGGVRYRAVNACILFMGQLEGRLVLTIEHVRAADGTLHPVQQAIVDQHGSQCGFCTPGFVMSLYAAYLNGERPSRLDACDLMAGNLCRCTGYGGLLTAVEQLGDVVRPHWDMERRAGDAAALMAIQHDDSVTFGDGSARAVIPRNLDDVAACIEANPQACLIAGATDVGLWVTKQHRTLSTLVHLDCVSALTAIEVSSSELRIGAAVRYGDVESVLARYYPDFGELVRRIGGRQVRNSGTIGGNIANGSPIGDTSPALIALGARLNLRKGREAREIPIEDYFVDYGQQDRREGEFVVGISVPLLDEPLRLRCYKVSKRFDSDITAVLGAFNIRVAEGLVAEARIAYGGMAGVPKRAVRLEGALIGKSWTAATIASAQLALDVDFVPLSDLRASAGYRMQVAKAMLEKYFVETTEPDTATRLAGRAAAFG